MKDFLEQLAADLSLAAKAPNVLAYRVNSQTHEDFHKSDKIGRILRGGNRSGKSVAGTVEGVWRATGQHPYQRVPEPPTRGRIVTVDNDAGVNQIILPLLKQWIPPSQLKNGSWEDSYIKSHKELTLRNGSTIEIKTHQQEVDSFAGVPRHWIWYDEECPQAIFNECRLRLIDYNGVWFMTMTPVAGQEWIFDRFIVTANKNVDMFEVDITDNPHLSKAALASLEEDLTDDEKATRQRGVYVPKGGLILKEFDYDRHVIRPVAEVPKKWEVYMSVDHGYNNPTSILWHALSRRGEVVTFLEHYQAHWTIAQHAARIKQLEQQWRIKPVLRVCDPQMCEKTGESGASPLDNYRQFGINLVKAKRDVAGRIDKMNEYLKYDMWHITEDCLSTIKEARGYAFKAHMSPRIADRSNKREEPNKKNDHSMDSSGYFFNFLPRLTAAQKVRQYSERKETRSLTETNMEDFPWEIDKGFMNYQQEEYGFGEI